MRYNFVIPIQAYIENGPPDGDGNPLCRPLGCKELRLYVAEATDIQDALEQLSSKLQSIINPRMSRFS